MKVVHITRGFGDYFLELVNGLPAEIEVHVVLAEADEWLAGGVREDIHVFRSGAPAVRQIGNLSALFRVIKFIDRLRPDVIHVQAGVFWELAVLALFPKIAKIVTIHDVTKHLTKNAGHSFPQDFVDCAASLADCLIVHGTVIQREATSRFGEGRPVEVIRHGIISRYGVGGARKAPSENGNVLLFGTIDEYKGVEYLVSAEKILRRRFPDIEVRIAGQCKAKDYYSALATPEQHVRFDLRRQSDKDVSELFRWADVVVLPYVEASQSGVLQVAFAFGVPSVVTNVGALPEVVTDGKNGLVIEPRDAKGLADAIERLLIDHKLRAAIMAQMNICRNYDLNWQVLGEKTKRLYERVARAKRN